MTDYASFVESKRSIAVQTGLADIPSLSPHLFAWQRDVVRLALRRGRCALFEDCGLGKTIQQIEWAHHVPGRVLILAPLAVAEQTASEGEKFGIPVHHALTGESAGRILVTNYERLHHFNPADFTGVVLDESSILKNYDGATRTAIIEAFRHTPFKLACTATPAPNDHMELGNHAEFLGVCTRAEMLAQFFVHDGGETQSWRIKGHAVTDFWRWVCSWAVSIRNPADIGYDGTGYTLPPMRVHQETVHTDPAQGGELFPVEAITMGDRLAARRASVVARAERTASIVNNRTGAWVIWCHLNAEADLLRSMIPDAVEIRGSDSVEYKVATLAAFADGRARVLITKPSIAGFGLNWQHCHQMAFVGLSDSWEQYYQATRRCWRYGQNNPVDVYCIAADTEGAVVANLKRKDAEAARMAEDMVQHTRNAVASDLHSEAPPVPVQVFEGTLEGDGWTMHHGDCVEHVARMADNSVDYTIFSPPFASLYTYTDSPLDMGNCRTHDEFFQHFRFLVPSLFRVTAPGRLLSFHCMNLPTSKARDGVIGLTDFRGDLIRLFTDAGWIYHSEVVIWKDPVTAMQRTKALGLLHKTIRKDSAMSRQGIPDYLVTMRKPGENVKPIAHTADEFPVSRWQQYASPVWMDINPSDTLQYRSVREHEDEKHICPLQLTVIRRALELWTRPNDLVLSPFAGIGSEGYEALRMGRRFVGVELKSTYFRQACANLDAAALPAQSGLFADGVA